MKRLTERRNGLYYDIEECVVSNCSQKLGRYEDIEEELGIDLLTLLKIWEAVITKDYFWVKYNNELDKTDDIEIGDDENGLLFIYFYWSNGKHLVLYLKDYGKTYALTKRELEEERR